VRFSSLKEKKRELARQLAEQAQAEMIGMVGHTALFFREHTDPQKRVIHLPERDDQNPPADPEEES
jgi:RNA-binding protein